MDTSAIVSASQAAWASFAWRMPISVRSGSAYILVVSLANEIWRSELSHGPTSTRHLHRVWTSSCEEIMKRTGRR